MTSNPTGDGFDGDETELNSPTGWIPAREYDEVDIAALNPGPQCITVVGRIANFYDQPTPSKMPQAAKGCIKVIVKDDTGALTV